jgi:hypothetical protein
VVVGGLTLLAIAMIAGAATVLIHLIEFRMVPSTVREFLCILFYAAAIAGAALILVEYVHLRVLPIIRDSLSGCWRGLDTC